MTTTPATTLLRQRLHASRTTHPLAGDPLAEGVALLAAAYERQQAEYHAWLRGLGLLEAAQAAWDGHETFAVDPDELHAREAMARAAMETSEAAEDAAR